MSSFRQLYEGRRKKLIQKTKAIEPEFPSFKDWLQGRNFINLKTKQHDTFENLSKMQKAKIKKKYEKERLGFESMKYYAALERELDKKGKK